MTRCDGDCYLCTGNRCRRDPAPSPHEGEAARGDRCPSCDSRHWNIQIVAGKPVDRGWVGPLHRCRDEWHRVNNPAHRETAPSEARLRERMDELIEAVREWAAAEWPGGVKQASQFDADDRDRRVLVALAALASTPNPEERACTCPPSAFTGYYTPANSCPRHGSAPDPTPESGEGVARVDPCDRCGHGYPGARIVPLDNPPCPDCGERMANFDPPAPSPHEGEARCPDCRSDDPRVVGHPCDTERRSMGAVEFHEGEAARCDESLGEWNGGLCEYGCEGKCADLEHWQRRFAYLLGTAPAPSPHEGEAARCDTCGSCGSDNPRAWYCNGRLVRWFKDTGCPDPFHDPAPTEPRSISEEQLERLHWVANNGHPGQVSRDLSDLLAAYEQAEARADATAAGTS